MDVNEGLRPEEDLFRKKDKNLSRNRSSSDKYLFMDAADEEQYFRNMLAEVSEEERIASRAPKPDD